MTRTTFKALVGGSGILATWLAVSPQEGVPATSPPTTVQRSAAASEQVELNDQATRLRERISTAKLGPSTRNPFSFNVPKSPTPPTPRENAPLPVSVAPILPVVPPPPAMQLSGVALKNGKRIAIIAGSGQIYLVGEGDAVGGLYTVVKVDPEAVILRDLSGAERQLILPQ